MGWIPWPEVVLIKSWLDKNTDVHKPDFGRPGWTASNARDKDLCEQGVSPKGVSPQGVSPQGVSPQGVWPQGVSPIKKGCSLFRHIWRANGETNHREAQRVEAEAVQHDNTDPF